MISRSTVVYIIILLIVAGAYFYLKYDRAPDEENVLITPEATEQITYLFIAEEGIPTSIQIESKAGDIVEVARDANNAWTLKSPIEAKAEQGASEAAASQITTMRVLDKVQDLDPKIVGLDPPEYSLTVKFNNGVERTVHIGVVTPSESGYYVQEASGRDVSIVSKSAIDALLLLLTSPPYLETSTPSSSTTETAIPTP